MVSFNKELLAAAHRRRCCSISDLWIRPEYVGQLLVVDMPGETRGNGHDAVSTRINPNDIPVICSKVTDFCPELYAVSTPEKII